MANKKNNTGAENSGYGNSGNWNSGNCNSGDWNSGNWNSGNSNSGYGNSGNRNSGNRNSGDWNSGNWNSGNSNSGYFNRNEPPLRLFERDSEYTETTFRAKFGGANIHPLITEWISESDMTAAEKTAHPEFGNTGGYLKKHDYKAAWKTAWDKASQTDRNWFLNLPNFDAQIFFDITGIDVRIAEKKSLSGKEVKVILDGVEYTAIIQ